MAAVPSFSSVGPTDVELQQIQTRLSNAILALRKSGTPHQNQMVDYLLNQAHSQANDVATGVSTSSPVHNVLANVKSLLTNAQVISTPDGGLAASSMTDEGDLVGSYPYESLDPKWATAAACWLEHLPGNRKAPFNPNPPDPIGIGTTASIAIAGDWGTGFNYRPDGKSAPAQKVAKVITDLKPDYTVHLGDVYYAGTPNEENENFIDLWPSGQTSSFTLNSNHEMYSGGMGYFGSVLTADKFAAQQRSSFFALQNDDWFVIALDTAYHADELQLYLNGNLDSGQLAFLSNLLARDTTPNKRRTILLTHHNGLPLEGSPSNALWTQIQPLFANRQLWWYWGHTHAAIVYNDRITTTGGNGVIYPRCCGHGAIPAGAAPALQGNPLVPWHEKQKAPDLLYPERVQNGFALITLNGREMTEAFINEDGVTVYTRTFP